MIFMIKSCHIIFAWDRFKHFPGDTHTHTHIISMVLAQCYFVPCGECLIVRLLIAVTVEPDWDLWISSEGESTTLQGLTRLCLRVSLCTSAHFF